MGSEASATSPSLPTSNTLQQVDVTHLQRRRRSVLRHEDGDEVLLGQEDGEIGTKEEAAGTNLLLVSMQEKVKKCASCPSM